MLSVFISDQMFALKRKKKLAIGTQHHRRQKVQKKTVHHFDKHQHHQILAFILVLTLVLKKLINAPANQRKHFTC